ncbi:amino acid permease [Sporolactobacillus inulinus]|uniref:GABA permease (4-amino butyrate transport carrier) n=2 Tax=Sporolactobacillus inulinus TaxID=2078 RepID=A0A0U1QRN7_9BACL|nr:amino acid permease [Sporolactobacillus inulinus]KLI03471.1 GABA permease (4-amino butyrate transport carrier) [Sporolactobacillus inulinus CASD]
MMGATEKKKTELKRGLAPRHIMLMAMAGMIGTGIFKGSGDTLAIAGPSVTIAYLVCGLILFIVMVALAEMAIAYPGLNMQHLMHKAFGFRVSIMIGWLYWINWMIVTVVEVLAAGSFLQYWFPSVPLWVLAGLCGLFIVGINLFQVSLYGEFEFWFAGIKIGAIIVFIILGFLILFGVIPSPADPVKNIFGHGGFFPNGFGGMIAAFLVVIFSYGGSEMIGLTVTEAKEVEHILPRVIKSVVSRVALFYILPILIICGMMPWSSVSATESSPFVQVFETVGLPGVPHLMNFVLLTAVLSAANSGIYATTRTLYSMAERGEAPGFVRILSKHGVPLGGMALTTGFLAIGVSLAYFSPAQIINQLMSIPGFTVSLVWIAICAAELKLRPHYPKMPFFKMAGFPYMTFVGLIALILIFISFVINRANLVGTLTCLAIMAVLIVISFLVKKEGRETESEQTL